MTQNIKPVDQNYSLDEQVGFLLRLANQRHATIFQKHSIEQLTPTQFSALMRISEHEKLSQNHLGRLAGMDVATVKGVVERLRTKGLVELRADPDDKRRLVISLSAQGHDLAIELRDIGAKITAETLSPLTPAQRSTLVKLLHKIT